MQVGVDEALAASDVVDTTDGWVTSVWQRETLLLHDGADPLVAQISVQDVVACQETRQVDSSTTWNNNLPLICSFIGLKIRGYIACLQIQKCPARREEMN